MDRFAARTIVVGGLAVIVAIFGIFIFIFAEALPLFGAARVSEGTVVPVGGEGALVLGIDEWGEHPFVVRSDGTIDFVDAEQGVVETRSLPLPEGFVIHRVIYKQSAQTLLVGGEDATFVWLRVEFRPVFAADGTRERLEYSVKQERVIRLEGGAGAVHDLDLATAVALRTVAIILDDPEGAPTRLLVETFQRERTLFGVGEFEPAGLRELTADLPAPPVEALVANEADALVVRCANGEVAHWRRDGSAWRRVQVFRPFPAPDAIATMDFLQGSATLCFTSREGRNQLFSLTASPDAGLRFIPTTDFPRLAASDVRVVATSRRNKAFLLNDGEELSLRFATTGVERWRRPVDVPVTHLLLGAKYDRLLYLGQSGDLTICDLHDPHPEAGLRGYFGKIWYEGQAEPAYIWQSTGGTDDFEPKLSLVPLIFGSLKGTFYALLFAVPIALLAAIYTAQFMRPGLKRIVKPAMEIMASLPSVVLGFIGALWLAPILEDRIPSVLLAMIVLPLVMLGAGLLMHRAPTSLRHRLRDGNELFLAIPLLLCAFWVSWQVGPMLGEWFFGYPDPVTGERVADFRLWWSEHTEYTFQQKNALVVGIMMGFAVIPLIFTIAEEALANVPRSLISGSLALGASRWETTARVVLPTASAGLFSALMIGLGRAVGETMILVMATGNTPIMDFDLFSGMRTLSANIVFELPEAPYGGTLYRTLLLGALLLFGLTFFINTLAEVLRERLRHRYAVIG